MDHPFFSIIVVSYNAEKYIYDTIRSVLDQSFCDYEVIVKDACSTDRTVECVPKDARIRVYVTKDGGIYEGMNEAASYAKGKYLHFLNCGDTFASNDVLEKVSRIAEKYDDTNRVLYGDYFRGSIYCKQPSKLSDFYLYRTPLNHQSMFFGKEAFDAFGGFEVKYRIAADYDYTLKLYKSGTAYVYCPFAVCRYLGGGVSESAKGNAIKKEDYRMIHDRYYTAAEQGTNKLLLKLSLKGLRQKMASDHAPEWVRRLYRGIVNCVNR